MKKSSWRFSVSELTDDKLTIKAGPRLANADLSLELWGGARKSDVLSKLLGRDVEVA